jgi:hypothetical protein
VAIILLIQSPPQPYVTELDLRHSLVPDEIIEDLLSTMPVHKGPDLQEDRDLAKFDYITYMQRYMNGGDGHDNSDLSSDDEEEGVKVNGAGAGSSGD